MLAGEFGHGAGSRVLYFHPDPGALEERLRLAPAGLRTWLDFYGADDPLITTEILSRCWLPHDLCRQWFERQGLVWPSAFDPADLPRAKPVTRHPIPPKEERPGDLRPAVNPTLRAAIQNAENSHGTPGKSVAWKTFCDIVRSICRVQPNTRGYGDKSIERAVRAIKAEQDKHDKSDMSQKS